MKWRTRLQYYLVNVLTLGLYPRYVARRGQTPRLVSANEKTLSKLVAALGGASNIAGAEYTPTRLKVLISDRQLLQNDLLEALPGVTGVFITHKSVSLLVGAEAKTWALALEKMIN